MSSSRTDGSPDGKTYEKDTTLPWVSGRLHEHESTTVVSVNETNTAEFVGGDPRCGKNQKSGSVVLGASFETSPNSVSSSSATSSQSSTGCPERLLRRSRSEQQNYIGSSDVVDERIKCVHDSSTRLSRILEKPWNNLPQEYTGPESSELILQQHAILQQIQADQEGRRKRRPSSKAGLKEAPPACESSCRYGTSDASSFTSYSTSQHLHVCGELFDTLSVAPHKRNAPDGQDSISHQSENLPSNSDLVNLDWDDQSMIAEQHRIMKQIQEEQERNRMSGASSSILQRDEQSRESSSKSATWKASTVPQPPATPLDARQRKAYARNRAVAPSSRTQASFVPTKQSPAHDHAKLEAHGKGSHQQGMTGGKTSNSEGDTTCVLYSRRKLLIRHNKNTVDSIARGNAVLVQCPGCRTVLQVDSTAKLLYCTVCSAVSPIEQRFSIDHDFTIARAIQDEELQLALQRKFENEKPRL